MQNWQFFADQRDEDRLFKDFRGTAVFELPASSRVLREVAKALGEPKTVKNYPTAMDRSGLKYARAIAAGKNARMAACLPGRRELEDLYVFGPPVALLSLMAAK
jgi:hypothetical protein